MRKETELIKLIHFVLKPTDVLKHKENKTNWNVTSQNSLDSFIIEATTLLELEEIFRKRRELYLNYNLTLQPQIFVLANSDKKFGVYIDGKYYLFETILSAIDICFKSFYVFSFKYPVECRLVWKFFEIFIYELEGIESENNSNFLSFIKKMTKLRQK